MDGTVAQNQEQNQGSKKSSIAGMSILLEAVAANKILGGTIYDSLIATCGLESGEAEIYSWNVRNFERFGPAIAHSLRTRAHI